MLNCLSVTRERERERERDRETDRQTDRQTDRDRQTDGKKAPDAHSTSIHTSLSVIHAQAYKQQIRQESSDKFIILTLEKKTEAISAYLINNNKGKGQKED